MSADQEYTNLTVNHWLALKRSVQAIMVPEGSAVTLDEGQMVRVTQRLGDTFTVMSDIGQLFRIAGMDGDAIGETQIASPVSTASDESIEGQVAGHLKNTYDPEIPVNIVELGLVYGQEVSALPDGTHKVHIHLTLTAPGCGMSEVLKGDVERKLRGIQGVSEVLVEIVFEPPWTQDKMSDAAKLQLGMM